LALYMAWYVQQGWIREPPKQSNPPSPQAFLVFKCWFFSRKRIFGADAPGRPHGGECGVFLGHGVSAGYASLRSQVPNPAAHPQNRFLSGLPLPVLVQRSTLYIG